MSELKPYQMDKQRAIDILWAEIGNNQQPLYCTRKELCDAVELAEESICRAQSTSSRFVDCHIWEPGDRLETISDKCEVLIAAADIKTLIAQQPSNEPLTLNELRQMDGEPVLVVEYQESHYDYCGAKKIAYWALVDAKAERLLGENRHVTFAQIRKSECAAYRRPPERSENDGQTI